MSAPTGSIEFATLLEAALDSNSRLLAGDITTDNLFRPTQSDVARISDASNVVKVYDTLDLPDAHPEVVLAVQDNGSGKVKVVVLTEGDYLDGQRVKLSNQTVSAYDGDNLISNVTEGDEHVVTVTSGTRAVAVNEVTGQWACMNRSGTPSVEIFDIATNTLQFTITIVPGGFDMVWDTGQNKILVYSNASGGSLSIINPLTQLVTTVISSLAGAQHIEVNNVTSKCYVASFNDNQIFVIDTDNEVLLTTITIGIQNQPINLAIDEGNNLIYIINHGGSNQITKINGDTDIVVDTLTLTDNFYDAVALNDVTKKLYTVTRDSGFTSVIDLDTFTIDETFTVDVGTGLFQDMAVDKTLNVYYFVNSGDAIIDVINGNDNTVIKTLDPSFNPAFVDINTLNGDLFVTTPSDPSLMIFDLHTFDMEALTFTATSQGDAVRVLELNTTYELYAPITTPHGYEKADNTSLIITSKNVNVNTITMTGQSTTFLTDNNISRTDLSNLLVIDGSNVFPSTTNTFLNITGTTNAAAAFLILTRCLAVNFADLGTVSNVTFGHAGFGAAINYLKGFVFNDCRVLGRDIAVINSVPDVVLATINNLATDIRLFTSFVNMNPDISTGSMFDLNPATPLANQSSFVNGPDIIGGVYFKEGSERISPDLGFSDNGAGTVAVSDIGHGYDVGKSGQFAEFSETINYNGTFLLNVTGVDVYIITHEFLGNESSGIGKQVRNITNYQANNLSNIGGITVTGTVNNPAIFSVPSSIAGILQLGMTFSTVSSDSNLYGGSHVITSIDFDTNTFETEEFLGPDSTLVLTPLRTQITVPNHDLTGTTNILLDKTLSYDKGQPAEFLDVDNLILPLQPFLTNESIGVITDGSLTEKALNVFSNTVIGLGNSKAKGSIFSSGNTTSFTPTSSYGDIVLGAAGFAAEEAVDNLGWRLINEITGEMEYRGLQPFDGSVAIKMDLFSSGGSVVFSFIALKNGGVMVDNIETRISIGSDVEPGSLIIPITAVTGDRIKVQSLRESGGSTLTVNSYVAVAQ